jgi:hypothetical protein
MKKIIGSAVIILLTLIVALSAQQKPENTNTGPVSQTNIDPANRYYSTITDYFSGRTYYASQRLYGLDDLKVPLTNTSLIEALTNLNLSFLTLLRSEIYARHGYGFTSDYLKKTLTRTSWYRPNAMLNPVKDFNNNENRNMGYIQNLEKIDKKGLPGARQLSILLNLQKEETTKDELSKLYTATKDVKYLTN